MHSALSFGYDTVLTFTQALQLVGLTPSLFIILFLLTLTRRNPQTVVPAFYFLALGCSFALPLMELYGPFQHSRWLIGSLLMGESMLTAFSFLLICQFMMGRIPPIQYWLVLAIPIVGGGELIYAGLIQGSGEVCNSNDICTDIDSVKTLYHIFGSSLVFLLLIYYSARTKGLHSDDIVKKHKYWLIISLIMLHLLSLAVDLARVAGHLSGDDAQFISTILRLAFIYLVLTSLFRVFYPGLVTQVITFASRAVYNAQADKKHVEKLVTLLETDRVYRQMRLNRAKLAELVGINEHHLSRVINGHFHRNFNELINNYRIEEAKKRLATEATQVTTIGFEVGFNSIASFNRVFKEKVGVSPTEYRTAKNTA